MEASCIWALKGYSSSDGLRRPDPSPAQPAQLGGTVTAKPAIPGGRARSPPSPGGEYPGLIERLSFRTATCSLNSKTLKSLARRKEPPKTTLMTLSSGRIDEDLKYKFRDTFLYEWASGRVDKPVDYFVLTALDSLSDPLLLNRGKDMERKLPVLGPSGQPWPRPIVRSCAVFNLDSWNRNFPDFPVIRLP